jgi:uncharacterized membrane protein YhaH (DUF805 family)
LPTSKRRIRKWFAEAFNKFPDLKERSQRKAYWSFTLFNLLILVGTGLLSILLMGVNEGLGRGVLVLANMYLFAVLVPALFATVRRLQDAGLSGWNILWGAIPVIGGLMAWVMFLKPSQEGNNKWGPNPKSTSDWTSSGWREDVLDESRTPDDPILAPSEGIPKWAPASVRRVK